MSRATEPAPWAEFLTRHGHQTDTENPHAGMPLAALLVVLMSTDPVEHDYDDPRQSSAIPEGSPRKTTVRASAAEILRRIEHGQTNEPIDDRVRVIAMTRLYYDAQRLTDGDDPDRELRQHRESCEAALRLAQARRDDDATLLAGHLALRAAYVAQAWDEAIEIAELVTAGLPPVHKDADAEGPSVWQRTSGIVPAESLLARAQWRLCTRFRVMQTVNSIGSASREADFGALVRHEMAAIGDALGPVKPRVTALALDHERTLARRDGDRARAMASLQRLERWWQQNQNPQTRAVLLSAQSDMALSVNDFFGRLPDNLEQLGIEIRLAGVTPTDPRAPTLSEAREAISSAEARGLREALRRIGNAAYTVASTLTRSGRDMSDTGDAAEDLLDRSDEWLEIARSAFSTFAVNGLTAVAFATIRNNTLRAATPEQTRAVTDELFALLTQANRGGLRRNIVRLAAKTCDPSDQRAESALQAEWKIAAPAFRGRLSCALAELYARRARVCDEAESAKVWSAVETSAMRAVRELRHGNTYIDAEEAGRAYRLAAEAAEALPGNDPERSLRHQLELLLNAIHCLAYSLLLIGSDVERRRARRSAAPTLAAAARAAMSLGEGRAADVIMEAVRKDRVGVLLSELRRNPLVGENVRRHADAILAAFVASPEVDSDGDDESGSITRAVAVVESNRDRAVRAAEGVLGPLTAMIRPAFERQQSSRELLRQLSGQAPTTERVLLQYVRLDLDGQTATVARRVSWLDGGSETDLLDVIEVDAALLAVRPSEPGFFTLLPTLAEALLPLALVTELLRERPEPVRLHVIPTGLNHVPFEALPLDDTSMIIDRAVVSVHTGLTSMAALIDIHQRPSRAGTTVVFDPELPHARTELEAIRAALAIDVEARGVADLQRAFDTSDGVPGGVFVMAVHGTESENGWGQTKRMPDKASVLRPADLMTWTLPRLCVMASCHSSIEAVDGAELSGFPLAMFLRGATTVIGTVLAVPDRSTSEIMSHFWREYRTTADPVQSLRTAKLQWMAAEVGRRGSHREWAGIMLYGGAHY